jgi:hypothetical protein
MPRAALSGASAGRVRIDAHGDLADAEAAARLLEARKRRRAYF